MKKLISPHNSLNRRNFIKKFSAAALLVPSAMVLNQHALAQSSLAKKSDSPAIKLAPELDVPYWIDAEGKETSPFTLAAHKGKWIFLKCFQNWCPGCHATGFPTLRKLVKTFGNDHERIAFAAIQTTFEGHHTNNKAALRPLQLRYETPIPYGHDAGNPKLAKEVAAHYPSTMRNYATRGTPWMLIIAPDRTLVYSNFHINDDALIDYFQKEFA